jgi:hypothetical protein
MTLALFEAVCLGYVGVKLSYVLVKEERVGGAW